MDRNVIIATVLITAIMVVWLFLLTPPAGQQTAGAPDSLSVAQQTEQDVAALDDADRPSEAARATPTVSEPGFQRLADSVFAAVQDGDERLITVEHDLYTAVFSSRGATLKSFQLRTYTNFDRVTPVQLVDTARTGAVAMLFTSPASHAVDTRQIYFETDARGVIDAAAAERSLIFYVDLGGGQLRLTYRFVPGSYEVRLEIEELNATAFQTREGYLLVWDGGVPFSEDSPRTEAQSAGAYARSGGETERINLLRDEYEERRLTGDVEWIAVKNQYFMSVIMPDAPTRGAELIGARTFEPGDPSYREDYEASLMMRPAGAGSDAHTYRMYIGPMEYYRINDYGLKLYSMVDFGFRFLEWMVRPLAKFVFIPTFRFLGGMLPNYGLVIIVLAVLMKLVLWPLTRSSYKNMARMKELQPRMEAIKEKYGDNPQKQQEATMKMYRETGVNPLGGCLPMLLQYPVIIALWRFLPQSIEIRQQGFLWAADLSAPDKILQLPFEIPFYGDFVAGFTLLMGLSMVVQMQIQMASTPSNPQMKMFTYLMPVMIFAIFNRFASGLSLYYLCYNVFTAVQQKLMNKKTHDEAEAEAAAAEKNGKGGRREVKRAGKGGGRSGSNGKARSSDKSSGRSGKRIRK